MNVVEGNDVAVPVRADLAEHYSWGDGCDGWHLLRAPELSVIEERMPPGASEVPHRHARAQQFFFVLAGELTLAIGGARHVLGEREGLYVRPGDVHQVLNASAKPVDFLVISQPPSHGDRHAAAEEGKGDRASQ